MAWLRINIDIWVFIKVKIPLRSLNQYLRRFWNTLRKHLSTLVELIGKLGACTSSWLTSSWAHQSLIWVLAMTVEVWLLHWGTVLEYFWFSLEVQSIELLSNGRQVLGLNYIVARVLMWERFEDWSQCLWHGDHLCSRFLGLVPMARLRWARIWVVVVNQWRADSNIALSWQQLLIAIDVFVFLIDRFLIIDLLDEPELDLLSHVRAVRTVLLSEVIAAWSFALCHHVLGVCCLATISRTRWLSHLAAQTVRRVAELIRRSLWRDHWTYLGTVLEHFGWYFY